jgi:diguanylate cyclase (GGDEF)-like protein
MPQAPWRIPAPSEPSSSSSSTLAPWRTPGASSPWRRPLDQEPDPAQLFEGEVEEPSLFSIPTALRVVGGVGGSIVGGILGAGTGAVAGSAVPVAGTAAGAVAGGATGAAIGGGIGSGAGEWLAELLEVRRGQRKEVNPWQVGMQTAIGAVPMGRTATIASGALKGAALGGGASVGTELAESGQLPTMGQVGAGALGGGVLGGVTSGILNRFMRPRTPPPLPPGGAAGGGGPRPVPSVPPPGSPFRSVVRPTRQSWDPPPEVFPDPHEMAMAYQPNLPGAVQAGGRRMGGFQQGYGNLPPLPEGFDELNRIINAVDPEPLGVRPDTNPSLTRPLLPSDLDPNAPVIDQSTGLFPDSLRDVLAPPVEPTDFSRPGTNPSLSRPLVPSGLDPAPPVIDQTTGAPPPPLGLDPDRGLDDLDLSFLTREEQEWIRSGAADAGLPPPPPRGDTPNLTRPLVPSPLDATNAVPQTTGRFPDALRDVLEPVEPTDFSRPETNPPVTRPLVPSGLDPNPGGITQTTGATPPWMQTTAPPPSDLSRPPGPYPSLSRPLVPSGLDANPPAIDAPAPPLAEQPLAKILGDNPPVQGEGGDYARFGEEELRQAGPGKPGLEVDTDALRGETRIVMRDSQGNPLATARIINGQVFSIASSKTGGLASGRALKAVVAEIEKLKPTGIIGGLSPDAQRMLTRLLGQRDAATPPPAAAPPPPPADAPNPLGKLLGLVDEGVDNANDPAGTAAVNAIDPLVDPLTGLANRPGFDRRKVGPGRLIGRLDMDNLKAINDTLGHAAGDRAIKIAADVLAKFARRKGDVVARLGGDEFGLNLEAPLTPEATAQLQVTIETEIQRALQAAGLGEVAGRQTGASVGFGADEAAADLAAIARKRTRGVSQPRQAAPPAVTTAPGGNLGGRPPGGGPVFGEMDPDLIQVDPKTYQFKGGADAQGVTDRLAKVESWDPIAGGASPVILHKRLDGTHFVVDGHQRVGLAKRLKSHGRPVGNLRTIVLDEADGVTPGQARRIGAMLNLQQGTGTPTDIAKVLRQAPLTSAERARIPKDQTSGAKLRMGEDLAKLGDDAFLRVVNGQVSENPARNEAYGAIVGRLIDDPTQQTSALVELAKHAPDNAYEAEQFVKAIQSAGFEAGVQTDLFGSSEVANSLAGPISKILATARRVLQSEKSALGNAVRNEDRLTNRGNVLNTEANKAGAANAGALDRLLDTYGNTVGPVREELKRVAALLQRGEITANKAADAVLTVLEKERANGPGSPLRPAVRPDNAPGRPALTEAEIGKKTTQELNEYLSIYGSSIVPEEREIGTLIKRELTARAAKAKGPLDHVLPAAGKPPQATVEESQGILQQLAATLNVNNKPLVDTPPPLTLTGEAPPTGVVSKKDLEGLGQQGIFGDDAPKVAGAAAPTDVPPGGRVDGGASEGAPPAAPVPPSDAAWETSWKERYRKLMGRDNINADNRQSQALQAEALDKVGMEGHRRLVSEVIDEVSGIKRTPPPAGSGPGPAAVAGFVERPGVAAAARGAQGRSHIIHLSNTNTPDQMAVLTGISKDKLAQIRSGKIDPSEADLAKLAAAAKPATSSQLPATNRSLADIETRHEVRNPTKATEIAESMKRVGWKGRPLLVIKDGDREIAWTGTHRLDAAKQAGLTDVPRVEVEASALRDAGYDLDELTKLGKKARIEALRKAGQTEAADLLEVERGAKAVRESQSARTPTRGTGLSPREKGTNPRSIQRAEELLDEGRVDEAEELMSKQIEARIQAALKRGGDGSDGGSTLYSGGFDVEAFRRLAQKHPEAAWRATAGAIGASTGWYLDEDHPGRGALLGMMAGVGATKFPAFMQKLLDAEIKIGGGGVAPVRMARDKNKDIGLFELVGGTPERTIPEQFEMARPAFEKFLKALHEEHARTKAIIPQKRVQALRDRYVTPVIAQIRKEAKLAGDAKHTYKQKYITAFANRLAGHRTVGQRVISALSKDKLPPDFIERRIAGSVYYVGTGFGLDTALQNITQPILAMGHVPSKWIAKAYKDLATNPAAKRMVEGALLPLEKPADAIELTLGPFGRKVGKINAALDKIDPKRRRDPQMWLRMTDQKNREVVYYAARTYAESQGKSVAEADTWARQVMRKTQTEPGALGSNPFHAGPVSGSLRPFTKYPTVFTEHIIDTLKQASHGQNVGGAARLAATLGGLTLLGKATGIDMEDLLISGGRPLGLDISHPQRSIERIATGEATPTSRGVLDLMQHLRGEADHGLGEDAAGLAIPRYPRKLAEAVGHFQTEGSEGVHVKRGAGGKIKDVTTPNETLLNLLGLRTTRQTQRRHALSDFYEEAGDAKSQYESDRRQAYEDLGEAMDNGDTEGVQDAVRRIGNVSAVKQFLKNRHKLPEDRFYQTLPPKVRQQLRESLGEAQDLAPPGTRR